MKKKVYFMLMVLWSFSLSLFLFSKGEGSDSFQRDCPSCNTFGVQRFQEKKEAPPFTLKNLNGGRVSLNDFKGKPLLLHFWATWCATCREEIPQLERLLVAKRDQMAVILMTIDGEREKKVRRIVKEHQITSPVLLILKEKVMEQYEIRGWVPITFLIDQEGMIIGKMVGPRDWSSPEAWACFKELFGLR